MDVFDQGNWQTIFGCLRPQSSQYVRMLNTLTGCILSWLDSSTTVVIQSGASRTNPIDSCFKVVITLYARMVSKFLNYKEQDVKDYPSLISISQEWSFQSYSNHRPKSLSWPKQILYALKSKPVIILRNENSFLSTQEKSSESAKYRDTSIARDK
jgi:hypothetical protein